MSNMLTFCQLADVLIFWTFLEISGKSQGIFFNCFGRHYDIESIYILCNIYFFIPSGTARGRGLPSSSPERRTREGQTPKQAARSKRFCSKSLCGIFFLLVLILCLFSLQDTIFGKTNIIWLLDMTF